MTDKRRLIAEALEELVQSAKSGGPRTRLGLMARGSEHGPEELARAARSAQAQDPRLSVVLIGPRLEGFDDLEWIETPDCEADVVQALDRALSEGVVEGAVALHYPFPLGVTTVGRVVTPGRGKPLLLASTTGASSSQRLRRRGPGIQRVSFQERRDETHRPRLHRSGSGPRDPSRCW